MARAKKMVDVRVKVVTGPRIGAAEHSSRSTTTIFSHPLLIVVVVANSACSDDEDRHIYLLQYNRP